MPLIVCLYRCAARHGVGERSITFCSASATTDRAGELIGLKVDVSGEFITDFELIFVQEAFFYSSALFLEPDEAPSVAK